jgi:tRNA modification GTPase
MNPSEDTIAAISTPIGEGGIAIVRVSGPDALPIADSLLRCSGPPPSARAGGTFLYGHVHTEQDLDECILLIYKAPASYTREDVVEFQGHGGTAAAKRMLRAVLQAGARPAEPGEFTQRAFLSGRIDLLQAEAVMDLIEARSDRAAAAALEQLEGSLSTRFNQLYDRLLTSAADLEASLDFEEGELPTTAHATLCAQLQESQDALKTLALSWNEGHLLRDGALVVIAGKPNVGKSSLLNALLGKPRAIVTDVAGTTRDTLEEQFLINGFPIRLVDTAGIRDADCGIEQEGIRRARNQLDKSDLTLLLIDSSVPINTEDEALMAAVVPEKTVLVLNKIDKEQHLHIDDFPTFHTVQCSVRDDSGIESLKAAIADKLNLLPSTADAHAVISERHLALIHHAENHIERALHILKDGQMACETLAAAEIRDAIEGLGRVTGRHYHADLLDTVFSRFCVGK